MSEKIREALDSLATFIESTKDEADAMFVTLNGLAFTAIDEIAALRATQKELLAACESLVTSHNEEYRGKRFCLLCDYDSDSYPAHEIDCPVSFAAAAITKAKEAPPDKQE